MDKRKSGLAIIGIVSAISAIVPILNSDSVIFNSMLLLGSVALIVAALQGTAEGNGSRSPVSLIVLAALSFVAGSVGLFVL